MRKNSFMPVTLSTGRNNIIKEFKTEKHLIEKDVPISISVKDSSRNDDKVAAPVNNELEPMRRVKFIGH